MSKYTFGPWFVDGPPHNQIVWEDNENRVCFLAHSNGRDEERDIARGLLIAAAPEMIEALAMSTAEMMTAADLAEKQGLHTAANVLRSQCDFNRRLIAKATGTTP